MPRNERGVLSFSSQTWIKCTWCVMHGFSKQGYELYKLTTCDHDRRLPCAGLEHVTYIFCSERHRQYFRVSHKRMGNLPPGFKKIL